MKGEGGGEQGADQERSGNRGMRGMGVRDYGEGAEGKEKQGGREGAERRGDQETRQ